MEKKDLSLMREGSIEFYIYDVDKESIPSKAMNVFYNKRMEINRDISNLSINAYSDLYSQNELIIVDSMAASGVSAIRMLKECKKIKKIYINDINPEAVNLIKENIRINKLEKEQIQYVVLNKDANLLFYEIMSEQSEHQKNPNIISIDPFGTPNLYMDSAFKTLQKVNGLMCITATDTAVLFGVRAEACIRKYLSKPLHTEYSKEIGARILIYFISRIANINKIGIIPLLTFYSGHFIRSFSLSFKSKKEISEYYKNFGYILHCNNCGYRTAINFNILDTPKECPICENMGDLEYAGPLWIGKLHDVNFIEKIIALNNNSKSPNKKRIEKLLNYALDENDMPISYYNIHKLCQNLKLASVPKINDITNEIKKLGYHVSRTHFDFLSIKTNLDLSRIKNILLELQ
ncbi:MAG: tRNA (guanine(10)-N(2))-dimethyltransferase [Candidatus Hodarchaeota archaeon]